MSPVGRVFCQVGQGDEHCTQFGISHGFRGCPQVFGGVARGWPDSVRLRAGRLDRYHFGGDGGRRQAKSARSVEDATLIHADASGPDGRFDQQQDAVVAQGGVLDVVAERRGQLRDEPSAQHIEFARTCGEVGQRRTLRQRRRTVGIAGWQGRGRRQR